MASSSSINARGRSDDRISSESSASSTVFEKVSPASQSLLSPTHNHHNQSGSSSSQSNNSNSHTQSICNRCDKGHDIRTGGGRTLNVPLIALLRYLASCVSGSALVRIHTKVDTAWWPPEHKLLFNLVWVSFVWNFVAATLAVAGYAYFPSPRRICGMPPVSLSVGGRTVLSAGGPDEEEAEARRRTRRMAVSVFDLVLAFSVLALLLHSTQSMDQFWGAHYVGLRPKTTVMIVFVV